MIRRYSGDLILSVVITLVLVFGVSSSAQKGGGKGGGGVSHTALQTPPVQLGTSGGNVRDIANGFCCSGTLGALVTDGTNQFILSNTHVFAGDSVIGGNGRTAARGDDINQPGLIDANCQANGTNIVADLSDWAEFNTADNVDAAIAQVRAGMVRPDGAILEIGTLSENTVSAAVNMKVKKSGRTTRLTRSTISGLNATITVGYSDECAGDSFTDQFTGQILISNRGSRFLNSGDSGSLMVEDVSTNPRAVGLLYAGSSSIAVANPIQHVLNTFNVQMVGVASASGGADDAANAAQIRGLARAIQVQERNARRLLDVPGAIGHAVGLGNSPVIQILVEQITPAAQARAPRALEGIPVVLEEVGQVRAMPRCSKRK